MTHKEEEMIFSTMKTFKYANISIPDRAGHKVSLVRFLDRGFTRFYKGFGCSTVFSTLYDCILEPGYWATHTARH